MNREREMSEVMFIVRWFIKDSPLNKDEIGRLSGMKDGKGTSLQRIISPEELKKLLNDECLIQIWEEDVQDIRFRYYKIDDETAHARFLLRWI